LLREAHDPVTQEPLLCEQCGHVVPDMSFCPACGLATRASSRSSRKARRADRPVRIEPQSEDS
jgi:rRNA maturation endonuclease Nob1